MQREIEISAERIKRDLDHINGPALNAEGGITRLSYSPEYLHAAKYIISQCRELGLKCFVDRAGDIMARLEGTDARAKAFSFGSHADSVKNGGCFDGIAGVAIGLEVMRLVKRTGRVLENPVQLFAFAEEEGITSHYGLLGSSYFSGKISFDTFNGQKTEDGRSFGELAAVFVNEIMPSVDGEMGESAKKLAYFIEPHIEQGPVLDAEGGDIGVVSAITGISMTEITFAGEANHAGTTPMRMRKDPVRGLVEVAQKLDSRVREFESTVGTVGIIDVKPSASNVIPSQVRFTADVRSIDARSLELLIGEVREWSAEAAQKWGLAASAELRYHVPPVLMDEAISGRLLQIAQTKTDKASLLPSGAGHDTMELSRLCPVGMLFIPSKGGVSHSPLESSDYARLGLAARVLADFVLN